MERNQANGESHGRGYANAVLKAYASELRLQRQPIHAKEESVEEEDLNKASQSISLILVGCGKGHAI